MKQYNITIKEGIPYNYEITVDKGESFAINVQYRGWKVNNAVHNFVFYSGNTQITNYIEIKSSDITTGDYDIIHYITPMTDITTLSLGILNIPNYKQPMCKVTIKPESDSIILNDLLGASIKNSSATNLSADGTTTINLNSISKANNYIQINANGYNATPRFVFADESKNEVFATKGYTENTVTIAGQTRVTTAKGSTIELNPTKLKMFGNEMQIKTITVDGTTLSVLAVK